MAAPKKPNTGPATQAKIRKADERMAERLRDHGWTVISPEESRVYMKYRDGVK